MSNDKAEGRIEKIKKYDKSKAASVSHNIENRAQRADIVATSECNKSIKSFALFSIVLRLVFWVIFVLSDNKSHAKTRSL